jgi:parallel beta-helix repeat protein
MRTKKQVRLCLEELEPRVVLSTYYVAPGGSDSSPGTLAQPFATVNQGVSVLTPGDTLYLRGGTYNEALLNDIPSGTATAPVTISAYPGEAVTLQAPASGYGRGIDLSGSFQYIRILNLTLDGSLTTGNDSADGIKISYGNTNEFAHDILVSDCTIAHFGSQGILITSDPTMGDATDHNQILNCNIYDNGAARAELGHGMYVESDYNTIQACTIHDNSGNGIQVYGGNATTSDSVDSYNTISNNRIYNNGFNTPSHGDCGLTVWYGTDNVVSDNLIYGNDGAGIQLSAGASNTQVLNNTVYGNQGQAGFAGIDGGSFGGLVNTTLENNVSYGNGGGDYSMSTSSTGTVSDYNLTGDGSAVGAHSLPSSNPLFVNATGGDFHLSPSSPAIDAGIALPNVTVDLDGVSRPQGAGYDIGCYERPAGVVVHGVSHFSVTASTGSPVAGSSFSVTVTALDANNNTVSGYAGTIHFTSSDGQALLPADYTFTTADAGTHTFTGGVNLATSGVQAVSVADVTTGSLTGQVNVVVSPAAAWGLLVSAPAGASQGTPFTVTVTAIDSFGNTTTSYRGTVHFTTSDTGTGVTLPADYTFTAGDNGVHTFTGGVTLVTVGSETVTVTDAATNSIVGLAGVTVFQRRRHR